MLFTLLLIIDPIVAKTIYHGSILGYQCKINEQCSSYVPNSICFNHKCICQFGYKSDELFRCVYELRYRRQINFGRK